MTGHHARRAEVVSDPIMAFERALELASPDDVIFVTGSLYLVGDLRRYWMSRAAGRAAVSGGARPKP
jgi:folylpolyglutamate synthase/dihydropteroate synthase